MPSILRLFGALLLAALPVLNNASAAETKPHHLSIQVDQNDPAIMNLSLNNVVNILDTYNSKHEDVEIEVVAYGPGLHMLRDDTSPVKGRIKQITDMSFPSKVKFSACNNTKEGMEKREGHAITIVPEASLVPSGAVRLMELQEQGWSYLKP